MKPRERLFAISIVALLAIAGGYRLVHMLIVEPRAALVSALKAANERQADLESWIDRENATRQRWSDETQCTLGQDSDKALRVFREDVARLLKDNDLDTDLRISPRKPVVERRGVRKGFTELTLGVEVRGSLEQAVRFLRDFYERPYLVRVDSLSLNAGTSVASATKAATRGSERSDSRGRRAAPRTKEPNESELTIGMSLTTLVLPPIKDVPHKTLDVALLEAPQGESQPAVARRSPLRREDVSAYDAIFTTNMFKLYQEVRVVTVPTTRETGPVEQTEVVKQVPDPRRDAGHFKVVATVSLHGELIAYVEDDRDRTEPPVRHRLNDELDDGRLVLIHPRGIVVRTTPGEESASRAVHNYFYRLGKSFAERVELTADEHPEIWNELMLAYRRARADGGEAGSAD